MNSIALRVLTRILFVTALTTMAWPALSALSAPSSLSPDLSSTPLARPRISAVIDNDERILLTGNRHPQAIQANDRGAADGRLRMDRMILSLKTDSQQQQALHTLVADLHDRASPRFGQWLRPDQFARHFGLAEGDIEVISQWLQSQGFSIDEIPVGGQAIIFSGTVAQVRKAFHTDIRHYQIHGERHLANAAEPQIPAALADVVDGIVSLHDLRSRPMGKQIQAVPAYTSGSTHYLAAADLQTIYNLKAVHSSGITGSGRSIAILGRTNVVLSDIQQFRSTMNLPASTPQVIINGSDPGLVSGDQGESDLDLEWAGASAPGATIKFVTSASTDSTDGIDLSAVYAVSNNVADVISLSYGQCEASMGSAAVTYFSNLWRQAAAQGMTVLVSSGDSGAAGCDSADLTTSATRTRGVNGLCSSPYATCVGGSQFADTANPSLYWSSTTKASDQSSALSYIPEVVWNESGSNGGSGLWASGGGASLYFAKPAWQTTPGVPADGKRDVPDVSLTAAGHDGYLVYSSDNSTQTQTMYVFAGTSASAPAFAGIVALIDQKTGYRQGNINPTLYGLASRQASNGAPAYFHLITSGNNSVPGRSGYAASATNSHYNQATGLGSVDGYVLINHWTDLLPASTTTVTSSANPGVGGQTLTFTATVTGSSPSGTVQFADSGVNLGSPLALSSGVATLALGTLSLGSHSITARYSGDTGNLSSLSAALAQTILSPTTVTLTAAPASIAAGQALTLQATVTGLSPQGTIQFKDGSTLLGPSIPLAAGIATLGTHALTSAGSHVLTAEYSGDGNNASSISSPLIETVSRAATSVALSASATSITTTGSLTLTASVSGQGPTGSVQFTDNGSALGSAVPLVGATASLTASINTSGSHAIAAAYSGDTNNLGATSTPLTVVVTAANTAAEGTDVPTLPEWGMLLLGVLLLMTVHHAASGARVKAPVTKL